MPIVTVIIIGEAIVGSLSLITQTQYIQSIGPAQMQSMQIKSIKSSE